MAPLQVMEGTPRYQIDDFVAELLGRRQSTIQAMRPVLRSLVAELLRTIMAIKDERSWVDLDRTTVKQVEWAEEDGSWLIGLDLPGRVYVPGKADPNKMPQRYHVDELVAEIFARDYEARPLTYEVAQFVAAFVDQMSAIKKHQDHLDLTRVTCVNFRMLGESVIAFNLRYQGLPFLPQQARWV